MSILSTLNPKTSVQWVSQCNAVLVGFTRSHIVADSCTVLTEEGCCYIYNLTKLVYNVCTEDDSDVCIGPHVSFVVRRLLLVNG